MSKSDDDKHKIKYKDFIDKCHDIADKHEDYCNTYCFLDNKTRWYPHTKTCIKYRKEHHESFVECNSIFCLKMNETECLVPSYSKKTDNVEIINELTYYDTSDEEL